MAKLSLPRTLLSTSKFALQLINSLTRLIRAEREVKVASPEESGRIVSHENVYFFFGNLKRPSIPNDNYFIPVCVVLLNYAVMK